MTTLQPTAGSNGVTFASLLADATKLGEEAGKGRDTQIKFYLKVVEAAYQGHIDLDANKHGKDVDDALKLTEAYVKAQTGAVVFDSKAPNQRTAASKTRACIKGGMWPKGGTGEPMATVNQLMTDRQKLRGDPAQAKKLDDAANTLLRYLRTQVRRDNLITGSELKSFCFKTEPVTQTEGDYLDALRKKMNNAKVGKGGLHVDTTTAVAIVNECTKRLIAIAKENATPHGTMKASNGVTLANTSATP